MVRAESGARRGESLVEGGAGGTGWDRGVGERGVGGGVERIGAWEVSRRGTRVMLGYSFIHDNARYSYSYSLFLFLGETPVADAVKPVGLFERLASRRCGCVGVNVRDGEFLARRDVSRGSSDERRVAVFPRHVYRWIARVVEETRESVYSGSRASSAHGCVETGGY